MLSDCANARAHTFFALNTLWRWNSPERRQKKANCKKNATKCCQHKKRRKQEIAVSRASGKTNWKFVHHFLAKIKWNAKRNLCTNFSIEHHLPMFSDWIHEWFSVWVCAASSPFCFRIDTDIRGLCNGIFKCVHATEISAFKMVSVSCVV